MRWFCRLNLRDPVPDHSTLPRLRNARWAARPKPGENSSTAFWRLHSSIHGGLMSARRDVSYAFEIEGRLAQTDISGTLAVRLEHSVPLGSSESSLVWLPAPWTLPVLMKAVANGKGALTASLVKSRQAETPLPGGSVMMVGASHEGKLLEYRAGRWITGWKPATELRAGHEFQSASTYFRRTANGLEIVIQTRGHIAETDVNFNLLGVEVDRIKHGKYISAYVFSPFTALLAILVAGISIGVWVLIIVLLVGML
jgi:hypothetical protein